FNLCSPIVNRIVVGRFLGGPALGLFTMAESLAEAPHKISSAVVHQLSFPIFAKLQHEDAELRRYFLTITKYVALAALPMQTGLALVAHDLVVVLLTAKWTPMVVLFQIFCVGNLFHILALPPYPLMVARGRAGTLLKLNGAAAVLIATAILLGAQVSLLAVGIGWFVVFVALKLVLLSMALRELGIPVRSYVRYISPSLLAALVMSVAVLGGRYAGATSGALVQRLAFEVILGASVYVATLLLLDRRLIGDMKSIIRDMFVSSHA
ncbi:MAG TPA: oligosaccharide flippase family protein, partial [Terriglobia bacterium]|nr:oligosaccharide flippase family protein [Terriglobia bacterium]